MEPPLLVPRVEAAAIDGRANNVFYRQTQLARLHDTLVAEVKAIQDAIATDYSHTRNEIAVEYFFAIQTVKRDYASLQPAQALEAENFIAHGKDDPTRTRPAGIVYIEPTTHTLFYSVITAVSAAITAGNCVIVLLENNLRAVSGILRRVLSAALDNDSFAIASEPVKDEAFMQQYFHVMQEGDAIHPRVNQLVSLPQRPTVAVVDRTADLDLAAQELVTARLAFAGRSPYAPSCILVNEFVMKDFLQAVVRQCVETHDHLGIDGSTSKMTSKSSTVNQSVQEMQKANGEVRVVVQEDKLAVVHIVSRSPALLATHFAAPVVVVHGMRSLDDAIDFINSSAGGPCLAAYHFGNGPSAKYLAQFVDAAVSFVNIVPKEMLVGPAFPTSHPVQSSTRYPTSLLTVPRPAFTGAKSEPVSAIQIRSNASVDWLLQEATKPLAVMKRSAGGSLGFFEQGVLLSAGIVLFSALSLSGAGIWWLRWGRYRM